MTTSSIVCSIGISAICATAASAVESVQMRVESVALFSNGYSQVRLVGDLPPDKELELHGLPVPVKGSLWWQLPHGVKALQVEGSISERNVSATDYSKREIIAANIGKQVSITMDDKQVYEGVLVREELPPVLSLTYTNHPDSSRQQQLSKEAPIFVKTSQGTYIDVDDEDILSIAFTELPAAPTRKELQPRLTMTLQEVAKGGTLKLECLSSGLSWTPTYRLDISEDDHFELSCKALITNDMVDIKNAYLELIAGQPELGDDGLPFSPLTRLDNMNMQVKAKEAYRSSRRSVMNEWESDDEAETGFALPQSSPVERTAELYHYSISDFSAKKDSAVAREIFAQHPSGQHVYICSIPQQYVDDHIIPVWHYLRLKNESTWPWCQGTVVCYSQGRLLSRSVIKNTAPGKGTLLKLAEAMGVNVRQHEVSGESRRIRPDEKEERTLTVSTQQGEITIENSEDHAVDVEIVKKLEGKVTEASDGGVISVLSVNTYNDTTSIIWKFRIEAGAKRTLSYTYEYRKK